MSETAAPRVKISLISTPGVEREYFNPWGGKGVMWNFGKLMAKLVLQPKVKAHGPLVFSNIIMEWAAWSSGV